MPLKQKHDQKWMYLFIYAFRMTFNLTTRPSQTNKILHCSRSF